MDPELPQYVHSTTQRPVRRNATGNATSTHSTSGTGHPPSRSTSRPPVEHLYHLTNSRDRPWLTLRVLSKAPASNYLPSFYEGDNIRGSVALNLGKEDSIKAISIQVLGQMTSSVTEVLNFVQVSETLWKSSSSESSSGSASHNDSKLVGEHSWPFLLNLPNVCQLPSRNGSMEAFPLPASFSERMARNHIQYQVIVTVHRSRFRVDSTLGTVVGYLPIIRPGPPSMARQLAYLENTPLPGPDADPDGWHCLDPLQVRGSVFSTREVDARCTFALAKPLSYTRGNAIPCVMVVETTDPQALDLLSAPRSLVVRLLRQIATGEAALSAPGTRLPSLDFERIVQEVATAVWRADGARKPHVRVLHGEIHLPPGLKPTCRLGSKFELSYSVAVYTPKAVAFQPDGGGDAALQQTPVVVGTAYPPGPRPQVYSPPAYDDASSRASEFRIFR
ncbi:hypothetical protein LXA43DRAFT_311003 [Ganoderma leucocontextum]|nr:hypothetical protein LXA43DRAFT_311003 [Ganoderma leucocontextum]